MTNEKTDADSARTELEIVRISIQALYQMMALAVRELEGAVVTAQEAALGKSQWTLDAYHMDQCLLKVNAGLSLLQQLATSLESRSAALPDQVVRTLKDSSEE